ncbi:MAG: hypothetical protein K8I27_03330 [Planctomycetes bacterium]|nr:hypothetical protein [Planctomycetota bacterium]
MRKVSGLLAFALFALMIAGCGAKADAPAKKWIDFLDKHKAALQGGSFDVAAFKSEGKPIVEELKQVKDTKQNKILMTESVLKEWNRANDEFGAAAGKNAEAAGAYLDMVLDIAGEDKTAE